MAPVISNPQQAFDMIAKVMYALVGETVPTGITEQDLYARMSALGDKLVANNGVVTFADLRNAL